MSESRLTVHPELAVAESDPGHKSIVKRVGSIGPLPAALLVLVIAGAATTGGFATIDNVRVILTSASITGIVAVSMTFLTLSGNYVSLGVQQNTVLAAVLYLSQVAAGLDPTVAAVICFVVLVAIAVAQGVAVALGMSTVITTLAVGAIIFGLLSSLVGGRTITSEGRSIGFLGRSLLWGLPVPVYALILVTIVATVISSRTSIGRRCLLLGASRPTAVLSGVSVLRTTVFAFVALGVGAAMAGVLTAAQLGQASASDLSSLTTDVVAAVLVGGTSMAGGRGSPLRSAAGAVLIALLNNVMILHGLSMGWRLLAQGMLVVVVVLGMHRFGKGRQ